jgi:outer membrane protein assembly factor BamB
MHRAVLRCSLLFCSSCLVFAGDWTDYRGPKRDGTSPEKNLPSKWSPTGDNLAWKAPLGGRSSPVIMGDRLYVMNSTGKDDTLRERVMCLNADTGKVLWEHSYNVYLSDVPPHRASWSSPAIDPETGNVYTFGVGGTLLGFNKDGKVLWEHSLSEEMGLVTTHGGRTVSPVVEGDLVIVSGIATGWGELARAGQRFMAFDKRTGQMLWLSSPGGRPYDTTYSPPVIADVEGTRLFIAGGGDGTVHALKVWTGEPVWRYVISKRGINTGAAISGNTVIVSHSEENTDSSEMGFLAAIDARSKGEVGKAQVKWSKMGWQGGFSSPIIDGDRLIQVDNGANLFAFDVNTGKTLWQQNLGTIQKASPVLADGKIYVGSENGRFWILKPGQEKVEVLDEDQLGTEGQIEQIIASPAVSNGRIYLVTTENIYCIGKKAVTPSAPVKWDNRAAAGATPASMLVTPTELLLQPGEKVQFHARLYDATGRFIREDKATWSLEQLQGDIKDGNYTAPSAFQAGKVKATAGNLSGTARVRIVQPLPWSENFDSVAAGAVPPYWINASGKASVREVEGKKVLVKHSDNPFTKRARIFMGPTDWKNYTVEADVFATEKRRQMGDAGVVAQRYNLILFGNHQRLELQSWQPETHRTVAKEFPWKPNTWYHIKLRVENRPDGKVLAQGKAWPTAETEPEKWQIEKVDSNGNHQGSPGIYADAPYEVMFDNLKVTANQ